MQAWNLKQQKKAALALAEWADDLVAEIGHELLSLQIIDQGQLYAATTRSPVQLVGTRLRVVIFNPTEYAISIEFGRRPGGKPPPLLPLVGWAGRKGIISLPRNISFGGEWAAKWAASGAILRNMKKGRKSGKGSKKALDPQIRDLLIVRLIAQKIAEKGTKGRRPFAIAFDRKAASFHADIAAIMRR